jgi:hypothetical protein
MEEQDRLKALRKLLYKEIQGELSYNEKKEFLNESIDSRIVADVHEKYLRRKKYLTISVIIYGVYLMALLLMMLLAARSHLMIALIILAMALLPVFIGLFFSRTVMGYRKMDLALRLVTKFYVKKKIDV